MHYVTAGIDGCKSGWLMVKHSKEGYAFGVYPNIQNLVNEHPDIQRVLIDIPIGLSTFLTLGQHDIQIVESHPEFCFKYLNNKNILLSKKKSIEGEKERLNILSKYDLELVNVYQKIRQITPRKSVANDDIIDALCLALTNQLAGKTGLQILADDNRTDEHGVHIGIGYYHMPAV